MVNVYFYCGGDGGYSGDPLRAVQREVHGEPDLQQAMEALIDGPTEEELAAGYRSGVRPKAVVGPVEASIVDGVALIQIPIQPTKWPNLGTSNVTTYFLRPVLATAFQFEHVEAVDLSGVCAGTELDCSAQISREEFEQMEHSLVNAAGE